MGRTPTPGLAPPSPSRVPGPVLGTTNTHAKQRYHPAWSSRPGREAGQGTGSNDLSVTGKNQGPGAPAASERERESAPDRESSLHGSLNSLERVSHGDAKLLGHLANQTRQSAGGLRRTKELGAGEERCGVGVCADRLLQAWAVTREAGLDSLALTRGRKSGQRLVNAVRDVAMLVCPLCSLLLLSQIPVTS